MKKKLSKKQYIIDYVTKTSNFKIILIFTIFVSFYGSYIIGYGIEGFFETAILSYSSSYYNIMFFSILALNTINTCAIFKENKDYIIRLKNRKNYLFELIKIVLEVNFLLIIIQILFYFTILLLTKLGDFKVTQYMDYGISNLVYTIFLLLRYYIYAIILSIMNTLIYERLGDKKTIIIDFLFIILFGLFPASLIISTKFNLLPWSYFNLRNYGGFSIEIVHSLCYLIILEISTIILFKIVCQRKQIFTKYLIYNDLRYLLKRQKIIILLIVLIPVIISIVVLNKELSATIIISKILGLNINIREMEIVPILMYFFNMIAFLYLAFFNYIKDYQNNLEQVYLRKSFKDFFIPKTILFSLVIFVVKILQYLLIIGMLLLNGYSLDVYQLFYLFIIDYLYVVTIVQLFMAIYLSYVVFKKTRLIVGLIGIIIIINIPVNIMYLKKYVNIVLLILLLIVIYSNYLNIKYHKKIIEQVGGK